MHCIFNVQYMWVRAEGKVGEKYLDIICLLVCSEGRQLPVGWAARSSGGTPHGESQHRGWHPEPIPSPPAREQGRLGGSEDSPSPGHWAPVGAVLGSGSGLVRKVGQDQ